MAILAKLQKNGAVESEELLDTFTKQEIEEIYPALSRITMRMLAEELELMGYVTATDGRISVTPAGESKLRTFKEGLPADHLEAFEKYAQETA